jgi:DNA polymerase-3 subunit gamma/tau
MTRQPEQMSDSEPMLGLDAAPQTAYRVLARKYRPQGFDALIGQDTLVRTLANAFALGRIAHAFMLTGVRGVGKTTTARIVAKALNCIGPDGALTAPVLTPCGQCGPCLEIAESRHVDVLEMDAASRTGIDDIREIVDGVRYAPASARYKVYIIDEVHMLSKQAFNGLLKTLEEPPPHVKFIFATTEIRKVPVTVLSRCQRFDLRRVNHAELMANLSMICAKEGFSAEDAALSHLARAAQGSVRDAQSLLDQAMAHAEDRKIAEEPVRAMLGLADRTRILDLFEHLMRGAIPEALAEFRGQYDLGADPLTVLQDLSAVVHEVTRQKLSAGAASRQWAEAEAARIAKLGQGLSVPQLTRAWQIMLKAIGEVQNAPDAAAAMEMALIRIAFASELPPPERLVKALLDTPAQEAQPRSGSAPQTIARGPPLTRGATARAEPVRLADAKPSPIQNSVAPAPKPGVASPIDWPAVAQLAGTMKALRLKFEIEHRMRLVSFERGRIEINLMPSTDRHVPGELSERLSAWTGERWIVTVSNTPGAQTLAELSAETEAMRRTEAAQDPLLKAALAVFPGAKILSVRDLEIAAPSESETEA